MSVENQEGNSEEKCQLEFAIFEETFGDSRVLCNLTRLEGSFFVYLGDKADTSFTDLSVAMQMSSGGKTISSNLIGTEENELSTGISRRLGERLGVPVFLSFNLKMTNRKSILEVEEWLKNQIVARYGTAL